MTHDDAVACIERLTRLPQLRVSTNLH